MEDEVNFSSTQNLGENSNKEKNEIKTEAVTLKPELVEIKKEPEANNRTEISVDNYLTNIYKTEQNIDLESFKYSHFETKAQIELLSLNTIKGEILKVKREDLGLGNYLNPEVTNQNIAKYDIKEENMEYDNAVHYLENPDGLEEAMQEENFIDQDSAELMEQNESLDGKIETEMFGISEMFSFTSQEVIRCKYCNFETKHKNQLWGHMQIHNDSLNSKSQEVILYKCPYPECKFQTVYKYSITKHVNTHKVQKFKCSKCSYVTLQLKKYNRHIKSCEKVPEDKLLKCDECNFKVKTEGLLLVHKRRHRNESKLLKCPECGLTTMYASALKKHIEKHRRDESMGEALFNCTKCSYRSTSKTMLMRHEKVHGEEEEVNEGKYQCSDCSFQTMSLDELESHMVEHKGDKEGEVNTEEASPKMYHCPECFFKTSVISKANHHKNLHIRQRNGEIYKCEHCNYETMYKYLLKRHSFKHKDTDSITTYPCDLCDYRAKLKDYLVRHKRTHMKKQLQQYKCTVCLFETIYKHTFKEHLARHNISLVDVKKFLGDKPDPAEASSVYVSEEVVELQNVLKDIVPGDSEGKLDSEVT